MTKSVYSPHSNEEDGLALGAIIYEALLLALSLHLHRDRRRFSEVVPGTNWNRERQIALELMVVKCRVLDDFLTSFGSKEDDIHALDFDYKLSTEYAGLAEEFRIAINKRTAHLTWTRVKNVPLPDWDKVGDGAENHTREVLKETIRFLEKTLERGIQLQTPKHEGYWAALKLAYAAIE
jgi:hypothetical protein